MNVRHLLVLMALQAVPSMGLAADWQVDPAGSSIRFSGVQVGVPFTGRFQRFEAAVSFDPAKPETGSAKVLIDLTSAKTGDVQRDEAMPQKDWFDVKAEATARFEASRFVAKGDGRYDAVGTLTIRGRSKPVTLPFRLGLDGGHAHAVGHLDLVRTEFGVGQGPWASGQWVALEVGVDVDLVASIKSGL
ncbi:YceI family protein [Methylobacterium trifolii]|uniref:Protein YceI n=1 Tax=Methylobacterium trifolii TaxID=1003092 RepID=A0ABQ4TVZ2_9HYPH|nr:YceI family protein [Methylobacterium trifolii]GJE59410.1 Protein YceI [Methylobacterium trifolii]